MQHSHRSYTSIFAGLLVFVGLLALTLSRIDLAPDIGLQSWVAVVFGLLIIFTTTFGVQLPTGLVSLLPMTTLTAFLVLGLPWAAWLAYLGSLGHALIRHLFARQLGERPEPGWSGAAGRAMANAAIQTSGILVAGLLYPAWGGALPLHAVAPSDVLSLVGLGIIYFGINYLGAGIYLRARSQELFKHYFRSLPSVFLLEGAPAVFAPLFALTYLRLGAGMFLLFAGSLVAWSLITRNLALSRARLERRVKELDSLQVVGQALSTSLDLDVILETIYAQTARLMPAENFYVALYNQAVDEVTFPLAVENGNRVRWQDRRTGNGLTEYVLRSGRPLLIQRDLTDVVQGFGIDLVGRTAKSWLGVPMMAGADTLGVIAIQSYSEIQTLDLSDQDVLATIAAQAALAIRNAQLYASTDAALATRLQELDSILRTTAEGILLFDNEWKVLAANPALANYLNVPFSSICSSYLNQPRTDGGPPLMAGLGYTENKLSDETGLLIDQDSDRVSQAIILPGPVERHMQRTLAPVYHRSGMIGAWLLIFREVTEEVKLERLREDMMHMLIHDLRSPLATLSSGLSTMQEILTRKLDPQELDKLIELAMRASDRMMSLVNELLEINRLESGEIQVRKRPVNLCQLVDEVRQGLLPLIDEAQIQTTVALDPGLGEVPLDDRQMSRVLNNLLDNAIKFTPNGGNVSVWAHMEADVAPSSLLIGITDNGPGIPAEAQKRIFDKFQRVAGARSRRLGTGLGLAFCKLAVEAHGGEIWVDSREGEGSTFTIRLPLV